VISIHRDTELFRVIHTIFVLRGCTHV